MLNETNCDWLFDMSVKWHHGRALVNESCHLFCRQSEGRLDGPSVGTETGLLPALFATVYNSSLKTLISSVFLESDYQRGSELIVLRRLDFIESKPEFWRSRPRPNYFDMGLTRSEHEVLERGRCQQRRLERTQMAWGCKLQACAAMFVAGATVGNCILRLQQAIIWDAQTDADWINETGKQPPAEGLLHVRLLFAETRSDVCIVLSVYLACGIGCFLVSCGRRTTHRNRFRFTQTHASRLSEGSFRTSAIRLFCGLFIWLWVCVRFGVSRGFD